MTNLEIIKKNKQDYAELLAKIPTMQGIERVVAENITLWWIKGSGGKWLGGFGGGRYADKLYERAAAYGYAFEELDAEFQRQSKAYLI